MRELALYLARKNADYKMGIPLVLDPVKSGKILFIYEKENQENREFTNGLIEKGLKLKVKDQAIESAADKKFDIDKSLDLKPRYVVVFGEAALKKAGLDKFAGKELFEHKGLPFVCAPAIEDLKDSPISKKQLWNNIKDL